VAEVRPVDPVALICGVMAVDAARLQQSVERLTRAFGPLEHESTVQPFDVTDYYEPEMGPFLMRQFVSFSRLIDPCALADVKLKTNALEQEFSENGCRRVNLDPGYLCPSKLVLATAKDFSHRVAIGSGIYAEVTLMFTKEGGIRTFHWTYPDLRSDVYHDFLFAARRQILP
jgi:hypothetical protein